MNFFSTWTSVIICSDFDTHVEDPPTPQLLNSCISVCCNRDPTPTVYTGKLFFHSSGGQKSQISPVSLPSPSCSRTLPGLRHTREVRICKLIPSAKIFFQVPGHEHTFLGATIQPYPASHSTTPASIAVTPYTCHRSIPTTAKRSLSNTLLSNCSCPSSQDPIPRVKIQYHCLPYLCLIHDPLLISALLTHLNTRSIIVTSSWQTSSTPMLLPFLSVTPCGKITTLTGSNIGPLHACP